MRRIIILGTGGNCIDILDTLNALNASSGSSQYECIGFLDDNEQCWETTRHGIPVLGPLSSASDYADCWFVNGIGSPSTFWRKQEIIGTTHVPLNRFQTLVHPSASVSAMSHLGRGTVILQHVTVASNARIGNHVIILPNAVISHDDVIGDYTSIAGGACLSGNVAVGHSSYVGAHASVMQDVRIGDYCLIGMGSVVLDSVDDDTVIVGNPSRFLRHTLPPDFQPPPDGTRSAGSHRR